MQKFWALAPHARIRKPTSFDPRYGFGKDNPAVIFDNGSIIRFRTTNQGAEALAGATIHYVLIDEPTDEPIFRELDRRLMRLNGQMGLTLTPINRPTEYLRQLVHDEVVRDIHARLTVANLTPIGWSHPFLLADGTPMDEFWINQQRKLVLARFAPVILDGEWECRVEGQVFNAFDPAVHVSPHLPDYQTLHLGIDHGEGDFREVGILAALDVSLQGHKVIIGVDEYTGDGMSTPDIDAEGILGMLRNGGWDWSDLRTAIGDRPTQGRFGRRNNTDLTSAIKRAEGIDKHQSLRPPIRQAKTGLGSGPGSVWRGVEFLHRAMLRPGHFVVHPRCERLIESLMKWDGTVYSEWKDAIDAFRYAIWDASMESTEARHQRYG